METFKRIQKKGTIQLLTTTIFTFPSESLKVENSGLQVSLWEALLVTEKYAHDLKLS